jgi:hypothetical protein
MGSDLYMEAQNFRPRRTLFFINGDDEFEIYKDSFYSGYNLSFKVPVDDTSREWIKSLGYRQTIIRPVMVAGRHEKAGS